MYNLFDKYFFCYELLYKLFLNKSYIGYGIR